MLITTIILMAEDVLHYRVKLSSKSISSACRQSFGVKVAFRNKPVTMSKLATNEENIIRPDYIAFLFCGYSTLARTSRIFILSSSYIKYNLEFAFCWIDVYHRSFNLLVSNCIMRIDVLTEEIGRMSAEQAWTFQKTWHLILTQVFALKLQLAF